MSAATATLAVAGCAGDAGSDDDSNETDGDDSYGDFDEDEPSEAPPDLAGTWDDFEDLDDWAPMDGSLDADTDQYFEGSQSALISVPESANSGRIIRTLSSPLDCSEVVPGLAMASDGPGAPSIQLWDEDGAKAEYRQETDATHPFVRRNFGLSKYEGDVDLSRIGEIHVVHWTGDEFEGQLWVDDLYFSPRSEEGKIQIQFHGGYEEDYTVAYPILAQHDLEATTFVATNRVRETQNAEGDRLTVEQLDELADAGWTVGSYGRRGLQSTDVDPDEREADVYEAVDWLNDRGYDGAGFFAFPGGRIEDRGYEAVTEAHDLAFAGRFPSQGHAANPHLCPRMTNPDPEEALNLLEWTATVGGITTIAFNRVDSEAQTALEALASELSAYQEEDVLEVITPQEMVDEYVF
ncbi:polysaccharide deacetylase family protein [Halovivax gelatinilyticus]|uniref:polysaccharide deacetylase family protein n=1 Tax=Halovivax gelatinilyticus TaxID=2961597 RepID=UPI0020CA8F4E|nr:polysaccharide deacetylase family protein [Halovivax gelatinilyticus]